MPDDTAQTAGTQPRSRTPEYEPPAGAETTGRLTVAATTIDYTATASWTVLRKQEKPAAEVFSVAYIAAPDAPDAPAAPDAPGAPDAPAAPNARATDRPVTFVFNGGPGASSAYLQMGAVGPTRVAFPADGSVPPVPPRLVPNEDSWLTFTDLVFIDPVGTGFSGTINPDRTPDASSGGAKKEKGEEPDPKEYFGYKRDLESMCEFVTRWLSAHNRWGSPVVIAGESYGGYRVGRLVKMLQEDAGVGLSGAILISPALELGSLSPTDYDVLGWLDLVPTMALAATHHGRSRAFAQGTPDDEVTAVAEQFATGDYATLLTRGASAPEPERARVLATLADLIGLPLDLVTRAEGRITIETFVRELLRDERRVLGFYDATVTSADPFPDRARSEAPDPTLSGFTPAFTTAINRQLRSEIGVSTDREYVLLSLEVNTAWRNDAPEHFFVPPVGATDDFRYGMALNPHMHAMIVHGRYDLVTPYYASDRLRNLMRLDPDVARRLTVRHFAGGHMFYAWEQSRREFTEAVAEFFARAVGER